MKAFHASERPRLLLLRRLAALLLLLAPAPVCSAADARLSSILAVQQMSAGNAAVVTVRGTATRVGKTISLQDQTGAIEAVPEQPSLAEVGDELEVTGLPTFVGDGLVLSHATVKDLWHSSAPPPLALGADDAANGEHSDALVQVEGRLLRAVAHGNTMVLQMEGGHQFFSAELPGVDQMTATERARLMHLAADSTIRLTGVLNLHADRYSTTRGSFSLMLRDAADVDVLRGPPWNTTPHIVELIVAVVLLGGLLQYAHVRSVRHRFRAILAERARIARDVHDTLAQGFAGIALQLEVVRGEMATNPSEAEAHLRTAVGMVRHCRAEAHRSIASLRAFSQPLTLPQMLREMISGLAASSQIEVELRFDRLQKTPEQTVAEQLFRICQEAVSNAVQHANATRILVSLQEVGHSQVLRVEDNGSGFDVNQAADGVVSHFGILGMQERAAQLGASWSLRSSHGGTIVQVSVPLRKVSRVPGRRLFAGRRPVQEGLKA